MATLNLEYIHLENNPTINGRIYAMIFDPETSTAIDFSTAAPYGLETFDGDQERFSRIVPENTPRTRHYLEQIDTDDITLPNVGYGKHYTIEFWSEAVSGVIDRAADSLLQIENLTWIEDRKAESRLDISQETSIASKAAVAVWDYLQSLATTPDSMGELLVGIPSQMAQEVMSYVIQSLSATFEETIEFIHGKISLLPDEPASARYEAFASFGYDSETSRFKVIAWLEKDGELQTDVQELDVLVLNELGNSVANFTNNTPESDGYFKSYVDAVTLNPDEVHFGRVKIMDADDNWHTSGSSPVTWD